MSSPRQVVITTFKTKSSIASLTRPANTTAYSAGDVIAAATTDDHLTFEEVVEQPNRTGSIEVARITSSANVATKPDIELWLFHTDIAEVGDNAAFAPTDAEMLTRIGIIDFPVASWKVGNAGSGATGNSCCEVVNQGVSLQGYGNDIYGVLVVRNGYVPVSGEIFTVELVVSQD